MFITRIASLFFSVLFSITSAFSFIPTSIWFGKETYDVTDSESIQLNLALIADTHSRSKYFNEFNVNIRKTLCGISQAETMPDALVIAGDISNAASEEEYRMIEWSFDTFNKVPNIIPCTGNHDIRGRDTYEESVNNFYNFADFCGIKTDKPYYSTTVKGYRFIILGSEKQQRLEATISDEQLQWFEAQIKDAMTTNKPFFIISHQPMYNSHEVYYVEGAEKNHGIGAESEKVESIIRKYVPDYENPVFFVSGHLHFAFDEKTLDSTFCKNLYSINLPSSTKTDEGGLGMAVEVYSDKILLRARNYITMEWLDGYQYTIPVAK